MSNTVFVNKEDVMNHRLEGMTIKDAFMFAAVMTYVRLEDETYVISRNVNGRES